MSERVSAVEMAVGFEIRAYDRTKLSDWVDAEVLACDSVEGPLLELTSLRDKSEHAIVADLYELAGVGPDLSTHLWLACLGSLVEKRGVDVSTAFWCVYSQLRDRDELTNAERTFVYQMDQDWADSGSHRTLEQVHADFLAFTSPYRHLLVGVR